MGASQSGASERWSLGEELTQQLAVEPAGRRDAVHGVAGGMADVVVALQRTERHRGGNADREPEPDGDGGADWIFREHTGLADGTSAGGRASGSCCGECGK